MDNKENISNVIDKLQNQLTKYQKFLGTTNEGKIAFELADDKIRECLGVLAMSDLELVENCTKAGVPVVDKGVIEAYRSECRGALSVWYSIRDGKGALEQELRKLRARKEEITKHTDQKKEEAIKKFS